MSRTRRIALQPLRFSNLCACATVVAFMAVSGGAASAQPEIDPDEFLLIASTYGSETQIAQVRASFYEQVQLPMPHWVKIDALKEMDVPHKGSVEVYPSYYQHAYSEVFGPVDPDPPTPGFAGFQAGKWYRVVVEKRDPGQTEWSGLGDLQWTHGQ